MRYYYNNELYHHGIKGMKWGVRRYQNEDGTLTEAGKKRYNNRQQEINKNKASIANEYQTINRRRKELSDLEKNGASSKTFSREIGKYKAKDLDPDDPFPEKDVYAYRTGGDDYFKSKDEALAGLKDHISSEIKFGENEVKYLQRQNSILMNAPITDRTFLENAERGKNLGYASGLLTAGGLLTAETALAGPLFGLGFGLLPAFLLGHYVGSSVERTTENFGVKKEYRRK